MYGKIYGSRNLGPQPSGAAKTSNSDLYYGDLRAIAFYPRKASKASNGVALMEAAPSVNVPLIQNEDGSEVRAVATYNFSPLQSATREAYVRLKPSEENQWTNCVLVGRTTAPFGLLTDEHRTYTRMQTNSTYNQYFMGASLSGGIPSLFHYDLLLANDLQGNGGFTNNDVTWGEVLNMRWSPAFFPGFIGASQNFQHTLAFHEPFAFSLYTAISLDRLTKRTLHGSLLAEVVSAKNWNDGTINPGLGQFFIGSDKLFQTSAARSRSVGYYGQAKYDLNDRWSLVYKFDYLALDTGFPADAFYRHGVGFEVFLNSNTILDTRVERGVAGRPEIKDTNTLAAEDDVLAMLRLWI